MTKTLWGIHAGTEGGADPLFREGGYLALGWSLLEDLSRIDANRPAFQAELTQAYPDAAAGAIPLWAGMLYRFLHDLKAGDLVAYPSRVDRQIHFFRVKDAPYRYDPEISPEFPNLRPAELLKSIPRSEFSQGALNEIGSALSFFRIKNNTDEFLAKLEGTPLPKRQAEPEAEVLQPPVAPDEELQDFVIKRLAKHLKGHPLASFIGHLLDLMGYRTQVSPPGRDGGVDILVHGDPLGMSGPVRKVQVKSTENQIGDPGRTRPCGSPARRRAWTLRNARNLQPRGQENGPRSEAYTADRWPGACSAHLRTLRKPRPPLPFTTAAPKGLGAGPSHIHRGVGRLGVM